MAKQLSILKVCKTEISENEPRQVAASLINSIIDTVIQLAVKKQKRHTASKSKTVKAVRTPKSEKKTKKGPETPLRVDDFLSSQHFGSQIEVGWDCNSPDALRNIQRYRGEHDTELSDIVMRLLDEEPQDHSQSPDNLTRISPPPFALWRGTNESVRPPRKLRPRKKSGDESSIQDTLYRSLINKLQKCESISEIEEENAAKEQQQDARECHSTEDSKSTEHERAAEGDLADEQHDKDKNFLNHSKDLFDSTKINESENDAFDATAVDNDKTVSKDDDNQLDKSDATWSDEELFDDSFIIKATQFPETLKTFNSPLIGMKRKQSEDGLPSKAKSPRYSFQLHPKTDINSNKFNNNNVKKVNVSAANHVSAVTGKPPIGLSKCASSNSATLVQKVPSAQNFGKTNGIKDKPNFAGGFTGRLNDQKGPVSGSLAGTDRTGSAVCSFTNSDGSRQINKSQSIRNIQSSSLASSKAVSGGISMKSTTTAQPSEKGSVSISRNSSFKKHNSFNGQESPKSGSTTWTRQRSFSGASNTGSSHTASASDLKSVSVSNTNFPAQANVPSVSGSRSGLNPLNKPSSGTSFYSKSKPCASVTPIPCSKSVPVNNARSVKPLYSTGSRIGPTSLNATKTSTLSASACNAKQTFGSFFKGQSGLSSSTRSCSTVSAYKGVGLPSTVSNTATLVNNSAKADYSSSLARVKQSEVVEEPFEESPVFGAKKRLSSSAFDTSLTDELLCKLAEPDDLFESQVCDTSVKTDMKQTSSNNVISASCHGNPSVSRTSNVQTVSKPGTKTMATINLKQTTSGSNVNNVNSVVVPAKADEKRSFSFKSNQKPVAVGVGQGVRQADDNKIGQQSSAGFRKPVASPEKPKTKTTAPAIDHNQYSEDLFGSDDDFMEDDGLTEPEILAMLDEVEFLATQKMKTSQELKNDQALNATNQFTPPSTPTKYSPSDIERKRQEAIKRKEMAAQRLSNSQESKTNIQSYLSPEKHDTLSQGKSPIKCSPEDIEKKRQQAIQRRQHNRAAQQLNFSQESKTTASASCVLGQSPTKDLPLSQGGSSSQSNSDKDFDNSQGNQSSPTKYSPAEIERKRLEAKKRRELSSSQESKVIQGEGHSPTKDLPLSQGHSSSQKSNEGANSTQIQPSPVKYSQVDIERKKQEALKRRKLKLTGVPRK